MHSKAGASTAVKVLRVLLPALCFIWILFIFSRSGQTGEVSGAASQQLAAWLSGAEEPVPGTELEGRLRKLGHFTEYALLGLLLMLALRAFTRRVVAYSGWPLLFGLGTATLDEIYQLFVPGRSGAVTDVVLDFAGLLAGMALALAGMALAAWLKTRAGARAAPGARP